MWRHIERAFGISLSKAALGAIGVVGVTLLGVFVVQSAPRPEASFDLADGSAWLPSTAIGGVSLLDGGAGSIATSLGVAAPGDALKVVQSGSDALIVNESEGTVSRLDGAGWRIATGRVQFGQPGTQLDVVADGDVGWVIKPGSVVPIDLETLSQREPVPVGASFAEGHVTGDGSLLFSSADPDVPVRRYPVAGGEPLEIEGLDGPVAFRDLGTETVGVDLDDRSVWVEGRGIVCAALEFPEGATLSVGGSGSDLLVVSETGGAMMWSPLSNGCPSTADFVALDASRFGTPVVTEGWAAVPDLDSGDVVVLDLVSRSVIARQPIDGLGAAALPATFELVAENGAVWFNEPSGTAAGLIRRDGNVIPVAKYDAGSDSGFVAAPVDEPGDEGREVSVAGALQEREERADDADEADPLVPESELAQPDTAAAEPERVEPEQPDSGNETTDTTTETPDNEDPGTDPDDGSEDPNENPPTTPPTTAPPGEEDDGDNETETPVIDIRIGVTAQQINAGESITFQSITIEGNPRFFDLQISPNTAVIGPFEAFGTFSYSFPNEGTYTATMEACDPDNNCDTDSISIEVLPPDFDIELVAAFTAPINIVAGEAVEFTDVSQGEPTEWSWIFEGGSPNSSAAQNPTTTFSTAGTKTITLTARSDDGQVKSTSLDIDVVAAAPAFTATINGPSTVTVGETITYSVSTDDPNGPTDPHWNVQAAADIAPSGDSVDVRWTISGTFNVNVTIGSGDDEITQDLLVTVEEPDPVAADLVLSCDRAEADVNVATNCSVSNPAAFTDYVWTQTGVGGGTAGSPGSYSFQSSTAGTATISVSATDLATSTSVTGNSVNVTITDAPVIQILPDVSVSGPTTLEEGQGGTWSVTNVGGPITSYSWTADGGASGTNETFSTSFATAGTYTVSLTATGAGSSSDSIVVTVNAPEEEPSPFGVACNLASAEQGTFVPCLLQGSASDFTNYNWSVAWPDPALANSWGASATEFHIGYLGTGTVTVTLTAVDNATGSTVSASDSITYTAPPADPAPEVSISGPASLETGQTGSFSVANSGGSITSITWSAEGQGGGSAEQYSVAWATAGTYSVSLSVSGPGGTSTSGLTVTVSDPAPVAAPFNMTCAAGSAAIGATVSCNFQGNAGDFSGMGWSTNYPNPASGTGWVSSSTQNVIKYEEAGTVTVTLSAVDIGTGQPVSVTRTIVYG